MAVAASTATVAYALGAPLAIGATSVGVLGSITVGTALTWALTIASIGYSIHQQRQLERSLTATNSDEGLQVAIRQAIPPQRLILGTGTSSGALFFSRANADTAPYAIFGYLLANHWCDGLEAIYLNNNRILINTATGLATSTPYYDGVTSFIEVSFRNGDIDQAIDPLLASECPDLPSTFRQRGHCTVVIKYHYGTGATAEEKRDRHTELFGQGAEPNPIFRTRGARVYDPRNPAHVLADETSYSWSDNAALCQMHYMRWKWPHIAERINWERVAEAADLDDKWLFTASGEAIRRHTLNGVVQSVEDASTVIGDLLSASSAKMIIDAGKIYPVPMHRKQPQGTLHLGMVKGGFQFNAAKPFSQLKNTSTVEFFDTERELKMVTGPVLKNAGQVTADGGERAQSVRLPFTERHERAQFINKRSLALSRLGRTLSVPVTIEALSWTAGKVYEVWLGDRYSFLNGQYELVNKTWDEELAGYRLELVEYADSVNDWNPANDEQPHALDETTLEAA